MPRRSNLNREQRRGEDAFSKQTIVQNLERDRRINLIRIGGLLFEIKERQLYKDILGDERATWSAYLSQTELLFSRHKIKYLIGIHHYFIIQRKMSPESMASYPFSRLVEIIKYANNDEAVDNLLSLSATATPQDWRDSINEVRGKTTSENCEHLFSNIRVCEHCGKKVKS